MTYTLVHLFFRIFFGTDEAIIVLFLKEIFFIKFSYNNDNDNDNDINQRGLIGALR